MTGVTVIMLKSFSLTAMILFMVIELIVPSEFVIIHILVDS